MNSEIILKSRTIKYLELKKDSLTNNQASTSKPATQAVQVVKKII